ncbi:hypothetical protein DMB66_59520 [Actinoplanes sp. ATCC 53533]|nr:hypothetical protein DMB66_59520 [Actinoplanes sp. ATCC 53533]
MWLTGIGTTIGEDLVEFPSPSLSSVLGYHVGRSNLAEALDCSLIAVQKTRGQNLLDHHGKR